MTSKPSVAPPPARFDATNGRQSTLLPMDGRGVMFSKNDGTFAIGFHHNRTTVDPNQSTFQVMFWCDGAPVTNGSCPFANQTLVLDTFNNHDLGLTYDSAKQQIRQSAGGGCDEEKRHQEAAAQPGDLEAP